jgi:hypothetical protein
VTKEADLTVCVPVYNGAGFVGEALGSLRDQTYGRFRVLVSVDPSDDSSLDVCRAWEADRRFRVVGQPARLGWPGNVNWLLARVETPLLCLVLHDDWIEPDYLDRLVARLEREPEAVIAYGDIRGFGTQALEIVQPSLLGDPFERVMAFLLTREGATEWRGVVRTESVRQTGLLRPDAGGFAADVLWLLEMAARGEFVREPGVVYHKRYRAGSVTHGWLGRSPDQAAVDWVEHAVACFWIALGAREWTDAQRQHLAAAALARAVRFAHVSGHPHPEPPDLAAVLARAGHTALRLLGILASGTPLPDEAALPPALRSSKAEVGDGRQ